MKNNIKSIALRIFSSLSVIAVIGFLMFGLPNSYSITHDDAWIYGLFCVIPMIPSTIVYAVVEQISKNILKCSISYFATLLLTITALLLFENAISGEGEGYFAAIAKWVLITGSLSYPINLLKTSSKLISLTYILGTFYLAGTILFVFIRVN